MILKKLLAVAPIPVKNPITKSLAYVGLTLLMDEVKIEANNKVKSIIFYIIWL